MADLIKKIKIKKQDGTFTDYIPIGADAINVETSDGESVQLKLNKKPYYYNNVIDMKADTKLKVGDMAVTLGYYEANDGGGAEYRIVNGNYTDDGGSYHELNNTLYAELIVKDKINVDQFGAKSNDPDFDNSTAFIRALKTVKNVTCGNRKKYYFKEDVNVRTLSKIDLDLNGSYLCNFVIKVFLAQDGTALSAWPLYSCHIYNGHIGEDYYNIEEKWNVPVIQTGMNVILENLDFWNKPYIVAFTNDYRDKNIFTNLYNHGGYNFSENQLTLDGISLITGWNQFSRISDTSVQNTTSKTGNGFAGDGWVFTQCNEWRFKNNSNYSFFSSYRNRPFTCIECIQSKFSLYSFSEAIFLGCHFEDSYAQVELKNSSPYQVMINFINCYFYNTHKIIDLSGITYENCFFRTGYDTVVKNIPLSTVCNNTFWWDMRCRLINCNFGSNIYISTDDFKKNKIAPRKTDHWSMSHYPEANSMVKVNDTEHGNFLKTGTYSYVIYEYLTTAPIARLKIEAELEITERTSRTVITNNDGGTLWGQGGGTIWKIYRTDPDGNIEYTEGYFDPVATHDNNDQNVPLRLYDYGTWMCFQVADVQRFSFICPWVPKESIPSNIPINNKVRECNGVLITTDNSAINNVPRGYVQVITS